MRSGAAGAGSPSSAASAVAGTMAVLLVAFAVTGLPVLLHGLGQATALVFCVASAALVANYALPAVPATLLCAYLFQNAFVATVSGSIDTLGDFNVIRAYNFVTTATIWAVLSAGYWAGPAEARAPSLRLMLWTSGALAVVAAYFLLGALTDPKAAAIYLRNIALPLLIFQTCLIAAARAGDLTRALPALGLILLAYGYAELLARAELFSLIDAHSFFALSMRQQILSGEFIRELQETGRVLRDIEDMFKVDIFNTSLLSDLKLRIYRLQGPNFSPISFAYALSVLGLFRLAAGRPLFFIASLPLLVAIGSKGALVVALLPATALVVLGLTRRRAVFAGLVAALTAYAAAVTFLGLKVGDYHVLGLLGGLKGFLANPLGRGLGVGGNLSTDMTRIDWDRAQALGGTDFAVESAVGVMLYQMGVAGLFVLFVLVLLARTAWRAARAGPARLELAAIAFGLLTVTANGLFQEEALFAPLALGTVMLFAGLFLGRLAFEGSRQPAGSLLASGRAGGMPASRA